MFVRHVYSIALIALLVLASFAYTPSLTGGFYHDDVPNITLNHHLKIDDLTSNSLYSAAVSSNAGKLKRPISMASFALNYYFFGDSSLSFRITNLGLHLVTGILVYLLVTQLTRLLAPSSSKSQIKWLAIITSALWLIHPLQVSTVAYIVQRMTILSTLFSLAGILLYLLGRARILERQKYGITLLCLSFFSIALGVFSKENAILAPLLIVLIEIIASRSRLKDSKFTKSAIWLIGFATLSCITFAFLYWSQIIGYIERGYSYREFNLVERILTQARVLVYYIQWYLLPNIQNMGLYHDDIQISRSLIQPLSTLICIILILATLISAYLARKRIPLYTLGIYWFFIAHLLESTVLPLEMTYEHRNYLPSVGLLLALTSLIDFTIRKLNIHFSAKAFTTVALILILPLTSITYVRASQWSSVLGFAHFETQHHPKSQRANYALGQAYSQLAITGQRQFEEDAYKYLNIAANLGEKNIYPEAGIIHLSYNLDNPVSPQVINTIANKLRYYPISFSSSDVLRELVACDQDRCLLPFDAGEFILDAALENPYTDKKSRLYSKILSAKAHLHLQHGRDLKKAQVLLQKAIDAAPHVVQHYADYINVQLQLNQPEIGLAYLQDAYEADVLNQNTEQLNAMKAIILEKMDSMKN